MIWNDIRDLLPDNAGTIYNTKRLISALSYREIREKYGAKIDAIIHRYIDKEKQKIEVSVQPKIIEKNQ